VKPTPTNSASAEVAELTAKLAEAQARLNAELGGLPEKYHFTSLEAFFAAVKANYKPAKGAKPKAAKTNSAAKSEKTSDKKKKRARVEITPEIEAKTVELVKAGKTAAEVSKEAGISEASVNVIKKKHGLTKPRGTAGAAS